MNIGSVRKSGIQISVLATFILLTIGHMIPLRDPDMWWHLALGEDILRTNTLPFVDNYSHTYDGTEWQYPDPLGGVWLAVSHNFFGDNGLVVIISLLFLTTYVFLFYRCRSSQMPISMWPTCALSMFFCLARFTLGRPQTIGFLFFAILLWIYARAIQRNERLLFLIPVLQIPWVNIHRSAFFSLLLVGLGVVAGVGRLRPTHVKAFLLTLAATFVHPNMWHAMMTTCEVLFRDNWSLSITEWNSVTPGMAVVVYGPLFLATTICVPLVAREWKSLRQGRVEFLFGFLILLGGLRYHRLLSFATLTILPLACILIARINFPKRCLVSSLYAMLLTIIMLLSWVAPKFAGPLRVFQPGLGIAKIFPKTSADFIENEFDHARLYNVLADGGYLLYRLRGKSKVFIDGRTSYLYPLSFAQEAQSALSSFDVWDRVTMKYDIDVAVVPVEHVNQFHSLLSGHPAWPVVLVDDYHVVHVRKDVLAKHPRLKVLQGVNLRKPFASLATLQRDPQSWKRTKEILERFEELAPESFKVTVLRAFAAHLDREENLEASLLKKALHLNPSYELAQKRLTQLGEM